MQCCYTGPCLSISQMWKNRLQQIVIIAIELCNCPLVAIYNCPTFFMFLVPAVFP